MVRGEVWWVERPDQKRRPYLVLARDEVVALLPRILAVPATTRARGIPTEVALDRDDGMPTGCVLTLDGTALMRKAYFIERITRLGPHKLDEVCRALKIATGC